MGRIVYCIALHFFVCFVGVVSSIFRCQPVVVISHFVVGLCQREMNDASEKLRSELFEMSYSSRLVMHVGIVRFVCWRCISVWKLPNESFVMKNVKWLANRDQKNPQNLCATHTHTHNSYKTWDIGIQWICMCISQCTVSSLNLYSYTPPQR